MHLKDLLGKKVIRTSPAVYKIGNGSEFHDRKLMDTPIFIWFATDYYAVYSHVDGYSKDDKLILQKEWMDDNWMDCEWLLKTANKDFLELMLQEKEPETDKEDKDVMISMFNKDEVEYLKFSLKCATDYMEYVKDEYKKQANMDIEPVIEWVKNVNDKLIVGK